MDNKKELILAETLGVNIACLTELDLKNLLFNQFKNGKKPLSIAKINSEFLERALVSEKFKKTLDAFDLRIADGSGVLWAARYLQLPITKFKFLRSIQAIWQMVYSGASLVFYPKYACNPIPIRFPGVEAMHLMVEVAANSGASVYFFGSEEEVSKKAIEKIKEKYPNLKVAGRKHGYIEDSKEVITEINKSGAELLIVALGSPKQEYWILENLDNLSYVKVVVGEGGSLDRVSGNHKKVPKWVNKLGIEWFWRLFAHQSKTKEVGHRTKRVWRAVPVFIYKTVKWKIKNA